MKRLKRPLTYLPDLIMVYDNLVLFYREKIGNEEQARQFSEKMQVFKAQLKILKEKEK